MALYRLGDGKRDKNTINFAASPPTPRKKKTTTCPDTAKHNQYKNSVLWYKRCDIRTTIQSYADWKESNWLDLPGKFCRTLIIGKLVWTFVSDCFRLKLFLFHSISRILKFLKIKPCQSPHPISPDFEWMDNELFRGKKKTPCVFFSRNFLDLGKKKHGFWIWMNEWPTVFSA